ncbi:Ppx/GppA phosphatase family protein [Terasakiella sp. A23]|uniref:Ppx/GppA phosphatase family protein n=1 Tax=Terasakiella sp. FCG-A23 TaxID=3080561 RepID=UPI002952D98D|nr:Ppx/GppA phosphatase family protein [Terasakiella sp. A23]MDV7339229.1 Ppx/GppA phosphatase family protein [Terasakiella sp. A23]
MASNYMHQRKRRQKTGRMQKNNSLPLYAALDLGTNNCRMLIARRTKQGFRVVDSFSRITRLGEDVAQSGRLSDDAMERTIKALAVCSKKLKSRNVTFVRSVATEACRRASNADTFLSRVIDETGIDLEAIHPEEEAKLALTGCASLLNLQKPKALVFDIGGGSTEIMWIELDRLGDPQVVDVISLPIGVVTVTEEYAQGDEVTPDDYQAIQNHVLNEIADFSKRNNIEADVAAAQVQMLGTSGTVTTLGAIHLRLPRYLRSKVDGMHLPFDEVHRVSQKLTEMNCHQRAAHPCIGVNRADLVLAGCAILEALCKLWPVGELTIADRGIREGILLKLMRDQDEKSRDQD